MREGAHGRTCLSCDALHGTRQVDLQLCPTQGEALHQGDYSSTSCTVRRCTQRSDDRVAHASRVCGGRHEKDAFLGRRGEQSSRGAVVAGSSCRSCGAVVVQPFGQERGIGMNN